MKNIITAFALLFIAQASFSQQKPQKFGKGFEYYGADSSFYMKFGLRFQTLYSSEWTVRDDDFGYVEDYSSNFLLRRSRLKFNGYAFTPKLKYKVEIGLTNKDIGGGINAEHNYAPRMILDAFVEWNFYGNFVLKAGQSKLPGNRERVISSANLQFVDRSRLNSRFNIDRDIGIQLKHSFTVGDNFLIREVAAFTQGEGRNMTMPNLGGYDYTFRLEMLPFGKFSSKGDYVGAAIKREEKPKLAFGVTYDINDGAVRERNQNGSFMIGTDGNYYGKTIYTLFADMMFKYKGFSFMAEYVNKTNQDGDANVYDATDTVVVGTQFIGTGFNLSLGYMFESNWEVAARYTAISPDPLASSNETEYTFGVSKYIVGHKLKVQTDISYRQRGYDGNTTTNLGSDDKLYWRLQFDLHF